MANSKEILTSAFMIFMTSLNSKNHVLVRRLIASAFLVVPTRKMSHARVAGCSRTKFRNVDQFVPNCIVPHQHRKLKNF